MDRQLNETYEANETQSQEAADLTGRVMRKECFTLPPHPHPHPRTFSYLPNLTFPLWVGKRAREKVHPWRVQF